MRARPLLLTWLLIGGLCFGHSGLAQPPPATGPDPSLDQAAAELALSSAELSPGRLRRALRKAGSDVVTAKATWVSSSSERNEWLRTLSLEAEAPVCFGEAVTERGRIVVAAERPGRLAVEETTVTYELAPGFRDAYLVVRDQSGTRRVVPSEAGTFAVARAANDAVDLQLVATGPSGPRPVARLGGEVPGYRVSGSEDHESRLAQIRQRAGAPTLRRNRRLETAAEEQAETVCESGRVRHGTRGGDPESRLLDHGIQARLVGEVAARASSSHRALDAIWESPSHELTALDRRFTDFGAGEAEDDLGRTCLVILFAAWPRPVGR